MTHSMVYGGSTASFCNAACHFTELESILGADIEEETKEDNKTSQRYICFEENLTWYLGSRFPQVRGEKLRKSSMTHTSLKL